MLALRSAFTMNLLFIWLLMVSHLGVHSHVTMGSNQRKLPPDLECQDSGSKVSKVLTLLVLVLFK